MSTHSKSNLAGVARLGAGMALGALALAAHALPSYDCQRLHDYSSGTGSWPAKLNNVGQAIALSSAGARGGRKEPPR